ncbi:MAG: hypothetical protein AB8B75_01110 [Roseobacter sp.]
MDHHIGEGNDSPFPKALGKEGRVAQILVRNGSDRTNAGNPEQKGKLHKSKIWALIIGAHELQHNGRWRKVQLWVHWGVSKEI